MRTIGVVTSSRADYWILLPVLKRINKNPVLRLRLYVTGMHLSAKFGLTMKFIKKDGFTIAARVPNLTDDDSPCGIALAIGRGIEGFSRVYRRQRPDILLVLGDRFEILAAVAAALPFNIPVAHIHGGEVTEGAFDDAIRHAITKISHLHFVSADVHARRVVQMGEEPWRVIVSGAPSLDNLRHAKFKSKESVCRRFGLRSEAKKLLVTYHPVTLAYKETLRHIRNLCKALEQFGDADILFTYPNADTCNSKIIGQIESFCKKQPNAGCVKNLGHDYFNLLNCVDAMVGNSSSGLIEAPFFNLPVINVGDRQNGRLRGANVIDCGYSAGDIKDALSTALSPGFRKKLKGMANPYGNGRASERIVRELMSVSTNRRLLMKKFIDFKKSETT